MNISDSKLMMIEQLTYLNFDAGDKGKNIRELLSGYTDEKLSAMTMSGGENADNAAVIRYIQSDEELCNLVLSDTMQDSDEKTLALCFQNPQNNQDAIVAFKGTTSKEWGDNIEGLNESDTARQLDALDYIESDLERYENITVVGHSKGGNKAMYVAVRSDKVDRCIAMDSQGFSQEFIDKYNLEIGLNAGKIKNYSISTDYVHALLFQLPGSEQIYCKGYRIGKDITRHHQPFTYFQINSEGKIVVDSNGDPIVVSQINGNAVQEDEAIVMLHGFTTFVLNVASADDKKKIVNYLATLADMTLGQECSLDELKNYILNDPESLSLILAYLVSYMDTYDLNSEDIDKLLTMLGLNSLDDIFTVKVLGTELCGLSDMLDFMLKQLTDGKKDHIISAFLTVISGLLKTDNINFDINKLWNDSEQKINSIGKISPSEGRKVPAVNINTPFFVINTATMRNCADRLNNVNKRIVDLDQRLDVLYKKVGLRDLWSLLQADLMTGYNWKIKNCVQYLNETANDFDNVERDIVNQF